MLFVLIFLAWLSLIAICWAVCGMAQRGDTELRHESSCDQSVDPSDAEIVVWNDPTEPIAKDIRNTSPSIY